MEKAARLCREARSPGERSRGGQRFAERGGEMTREVLSPNRPQTPGCAQATLRCQLNPSGVGLRRQGHL